MVTKGNTFERSTCHVGLIRIGYIRNVNILTWLRGFQDKLLYLVLFSLYPSLFLEIERQKNQSINQSINQ